MRKVVLFPLLLVAASITAGLYGALHNQISYTVSPEYFHGFKFNQFRIPDYLHGRIGAAIVGWRASWWMGYLVGVPVLLVGLILPGPRLYASRCMWAFLVVTGTALLFGASALTTSPKVEAWQWYPHEVQDKAAFARAAAMHNSSYLGGFLGIITGSLFLIGERFRLAGGKENAESAVKTVESPERE